MRSPKTVKLMALIGGLVLLSFGGTACGDDDGEPGENGEGVDNQAPNNQTPNNQDDDCGEGETVNPITGECIEAPENNGEPGEECDDGEVWDPTTDECVTDPEDGDDSDDDSGDDGGDDSGDDPDEEAECGPGGLIGQTCRPDGGAIPGATVTVEGFDCEGGPFAEETTADSEGYYDFDGLPAGDHTISIVSGSFEATEDVTIVKDQVTDRESIGEKVCLTGDEVDIAVVDGVFDDIAGLLDGMEIEYSLYTSSNKGDLLGDQDTLNDYEVVFAECSASLTASGFESSDLEFNMRRFVQEGGSLYASDRANDFIQEAMPEAMLFASDVDPDASSNSWVGSPGGDYPTRAVSDDMIDIFGDEPSDFDFTGGFAVVSSINDPGGQVLFETQYPEFYDGQGEWSPSMIAYDDPLGSGFMIFTEFHNSNQATDDVEEILEYIIFQL